ncbi:response regulator transcription factor EsaR [Burkholderia multivorans]|jgi:DNA-binding NtrC family response regulator|uniref:Sigma54 dependent DNA-binding transcriptional regulator n=3 Tax=Burkholderia multivorans TaxID=87883 RepID=A0A0H3KBA4_BURM1|nr:MULTISPECIES: response regulator transcription factor EsaR [Burkholderia]ABX16801.1 two component transcriptional regulator, Fis family [Burkholderia multivorans ATCC 17616]AIO74792.1 bacterial regulatory, Fis family protein [Burkholderia multivorans]AJY17618.1 bacterial regulatory, Fis family protein [Burkholderia multivorans ATCC BAA-247]AOJ94297.1 XRE family transcriptional regulator [Burkholderia multivorans]AOK68927.1 XRE family transcriptional regulator [Burkholderia multivorans]
MATILVVDDEMGIRELLSEILSDEGHVVEAAENAQAAREYRLNQAPDLVLLDIWMPDTDGVTLLKEWAAQGLLTMPVIMMSGHATIDTAVEATKIGALDFLEKPIALQKLLKAVEHGLARGAAPVSANAAAKAGAGQAAGPAAVASAAALPTLGDDVAAALGLAGQTAAIPFDIPLREARDAFERAYFEYHLARENGSMTRVAEKTGLERTHLYRKLKQLGVELGKKPSEGAA